MPGSFKNRIAQYEVPPPPDLWGRISHDLDTAFHPADVIIGSRLEDFSIPPPVRAWREIESILDNERRPSARIASLRYKRLAMVAVAISVVAITVVYLYSGGGRNVAPEMAALIKSSPDMQTKRPAFPSPATAIALRPATLPKKLSRAPQRYSEKQNQVETTEPEALPGITEVRFSDMTTVDQEEPVTIPALPLRDASGNIIMDKKLICRPNDPYITVTSPNGSQTKISSKFFSLLSYLNGDTPNDYANCDGMIWKHKFQSWRDKLLNEDSFVPAANNFFDIFEMKDIIEE